MSRLCFVVGLVWLFRLQPLFIDCVAARLVLLTFIAIVVASRRCFVGALAYWVPDCSPVVMLVLSLDVVVVVLGGISRSR